MKKAALILFVTICFLFVSFRIDYKMSAKANPTTIIVDDDGPPANFTNIQKAINNASSGDTIFVRKGTYYENVIVNKSIELIGEDRDLTIVTGSGKGNVVSVMTNNAYVKNFTIMGSGSLPDSGILVDHSRGNVISNNKIISNPSKGVSLYSSSSNVICGNNISTNNDGIYLYSSNNNTFSDNIISSNNYDGFYLYSSGNNTFFRNRILYNDLTGISLYYSSSNQIYGNNISGNEYGISFFLFSSNTTIYHNNFNNKKQVWADLTHTWDYGGEGNYWSDYPGRDLNEDGIGDSPYIIDENNRDNYPLMGTFSDFDTTLGRNTYHVTIVSNSSISDFGFQVGTETGNKIIHFKATSVDSVIGFSRVTIPRALMEDPNIVLIDTIEIVPTLLNITDETKVCLYLTYLNGNATVNIIFSEALYLYSELFAQYSELQRSFLALNDTYYGLLTNFVKLQADLLELSKAFNDSSTQYLELQGNFLALNDTYYGLLTNYNRLLGNYTSLLVRFSEMNASYQQHLSDNSEQTQNIQSLIYIFAATTAIFIMTTLYLSKLQATGMRRRTSRHIET